MIGEELLAPTSDSTMMICILRSGAEVASKGRIRANKFTLNNQFSLLINVTFLDCFRHSFGFNARQELPLYIGSQNQQQESELWWTGEPQIVAKI